MNASDWIYQGKVFGVKKSTFSLPSGELCQRDTIVHPGAAAILPITPEGKIALVEQYRHSVNSLLLEIPAGMLEPNESPRECAIRELQEEIGYYPQKLTPMGTIYPNPGMCNELIHLFVGSELRPSRQSAEDTDEITVKLYEIDDLIEEIEREKIIDAKTIIAVYRWLWKKKSPAS